MPNENRKEAMFSNTTYDVTKMVTTIGLPATSTLYFTLAAIWGLPYAEQVVGTLAAIATFLGVILGLSTKSYNASDAKYDGEVVVTTDGEGGTLYSLELNDNPVNFAEKKDLAFRVLPPPPFPK